MQIIQKNLKFYILCPFFILLGSFVTLCFVQLDNCDDTKLGENKRYYRTSNLRNPSLIIFILSAPKNLDRRSAVRETWLDDNVHKDIIHYFVIGSVGLSPDFLLHLSAEQSKYNDLLILPIQDSYSQLTYKMLQTFVWVDEQIYSGLNFSYLLKIDDDSFVRLDLLKNELNKLQKRIDTNDFDDINERTQSINIQTKVNKKNLNIYWGYFKGNANIKTQGKWKETNWVLCNNYIPYAQGGGYVLSKQLITYIAKNAEDFSLYNSEDVSVGTWLAPVSNLVRIHDVRFDTEWVSRGCQNSHIIFHNIRIDIMMTMHSNIKKYGKPCIEENFQRQKYIYNWNTQPSKCCSNFV